MKYIDVVKQGRDNYEKGVTSFTDILVEDLKTKGFIMTEQVQAATACLGRAVASCLTDVSPKRNDADYRFQWRVEDMPDGLEEVILRLASKYPYIEVKYLGDSTFNCSVFNYDGDSKVETGLTELIAVVGNCTAKLEREVNTISAGSGLPESSKKDVTSILGMCGLCYMFSITDSSAFVYNKDTFNKRELKFLLKIEGVTASEVTDTNKTYVKIQIETEEK